MNHKDISIASFQHKCLHGSLDSLHISVLILKGVHPQHGSPTLRHGQDLFHVLCSTPVPLSMYLLSFCLASELPLP